MITRNVRNNHAHEGGNLIEQEEYMRNPYYTRYRFSFGSLVGRFLKTRSSKLSVPLFIIFSAVFSLTTHPPVLAAALNLQKDAAGWTIFTPSSDTRIMYVSATGDNATGQIYTSANHPDWANPLAPSGAISAYATFAAAAANIRTGYPDWVLFKRGDTFYDQVTEFFKSGRSASEPIHIGSYGSSGLSPLLKLPAGSTGQGIKLSPSSWVDYTQRHIGIQGIHFYSYTRNPSDPGYVKNDGTDVLDIYGRYISNILVEGCIFRYGANNRVSGEISYGRLLDVTLRRNLFLDNYSEAGHSMGLGGGSTENFLAEENIFDHNGWLIKNYSGDTSDRVDGQATAYNHNVYFIGDKNSTFVNNISLRPSSMHFKHAIAAGPYSVEALLYNNNLLIDGEIGNDIAGNGANLGVGVQDLTFSNNVLYKIGLSNTTGRDISWGITIANVGERGAKVFSNLVLNHGLPDGMGDTGLLLGGYGDGDYTTRILNNVDIYDNIFYGGTGTSYSIRMLRTGANSKIRNNYFRRTTSSRNRTMYAEISSTDAMTHEFAGNQYYTVGGNSGGYRTATAEYTATQWLSNFEPTASFTEKVFPDDTRSVETYMTSVGETGTLDAFIAKARAQDRYSWDPLFTADAVNDYIRAGFGMGQRRLFRNVRVGEVEP